MEHTALEHEMAAHAATQRDLAAAQQRNKMLTAVNQAQRNALIESYAREMTQPDLKEAIQEHLSPESVALMAAYLLVAHCDDEHANTQVRWFQGQLVELLGGESALDDLINGLGL